MPRAWVVPRDGGAPVELNPDQVRSGRIRWQDSIPQQTSAASIREYRRTVLRPHNVYVYVDADSDAHPLPVWVTDEIQRQMEQRR